MRGGGPGDFRPQVPGVAENRVMFPEKGRQCASGYLVGCPCGVLSGDAPAPGRDEGFGGRVRRWLPGDCCFHSPQHPPLEERCAFQVSQIVDVPAFIIAQDI